MSPYIAYYENQAGGGSLERYNNFGRIYAGNPYQRGHGIGAFLGGLFRSILPRIGSLARSAARTVGKEALNAGFNVMTDVVANGKPLKGALEDRLTESGLKLKRKAQDKIESMMSGSGYKRRRKRLGAHKLVGRGSVKTSKTRKNKKKKRITPKKNKKRVKKSKSKRKTRDLYDIFH